MLNRLTEAAELLRDTLMANNIAGILKKGKFTVVALVGSAHALPLRSSYQESPLLYWRITFGIKQSAFLPRL